MKKYRTIISIVNRGMDEYDAGEKAGMMMDREMVKNGMYISCCQTRCISKREDSNPAFFHKHAEKKYLTTIYIVCSGRDIIDAAEDANRLFTLENMSIGSSMAWEDTEPVVHDPLAALEEDIEAYMCV